MTRYRGGEDVSMFTKIESYLLAFVAAYVTAHAGQDEAAIVAAGVSEANTFVNAALPAVAKPFEGWIDQAADAEIKTLITMAVTAAIHEVQKNVQVPATTAPAVVPTAETVHALANAAIASVEAEAKSPKAPGE